MVDRPIRFGLVGAALWLSACASTNPELPTPKDPVQTRYVVQTGDGWPRISELYFGGPQEAERLAADNGSRVAAGEPPAGTTIVVSIPPDQVEQVRRVEAARGPYNEGTQLFERGRDQQALEAFQRALEIAPELVDARYNAGLALLRLSRHSQAVDLLDEVVAVRPADKDARYALASAHFHLEEFEIAIEELKRVLAVDPRFLRARYTLAMAFERAGREQEAQDAWRRYLELDDSSAWADEARAHLVGS